MNIILIYRIYLIFWCILILCLGSWGFNNLPSKCTDNDIYTDLIILITTSLATLTFMICIITSSYICKTDNSIETGIYLAVGLLCLSILQIFSITRLAFKIDNCKFKDDSSRNYKNFLITSAVLSCIPLLHSCWKIFEYYTKHKKFVPSENDKDQLISEICQWTGRNPAMYSGWSYDELKQRHEAVRDESYKSAPYGAKQYPVRPIFVPSKNDKDELISEISQWTGENPVMYSGWSYQELKQRQEALRDEKPFGKEKKLSFLDQIKEHRQYL